MSTVVFIKFQNYSPPQKPPKTFRRSAPLLLRFCVATCPREPHGTVGNRRVGRQPAAAKSVVVWEEVGDSLFVRRRLAPKNYAALSRQRSAPSGSASSAHHPLKAMAHVNVTNIVVLNNPSSFTSPLQFEVTFECIRELRHDLEWKMTYVGSAESESYDQVLDSVLVGPVPVGVNRFVFQAAAPTPHQIPRDDLLGVTVVFISCFYQGREFIRVGYYVNTSLPEWDAQRAAAIEGMDIDESDGEDDEDAELGEDEDEEGGADNAMAASPTPGGSSAAAGVSPDAEVTDHDGEMDDADGTQAAATAAAAAAAPMRPELPENIDFNQVRLPRSGRSEANARP